MYSKLVADYLADEIHKRAFRECVLPFGWRMHELAFLYPSQTRQGLHPATLGWIDYVNSAVIREMTQGEG